MAKQRRAAERSSATSPWEWVAASVGGAMICAAIGYMIWYGLTSREGVPELELEAVATTQAGASYLVEVEVRNQGRATAAAAEIEGQITGPDGPLETSEATIDFVPPNSSRKAFLQFTKDPAGRLQLRVKGMAQP
jgi:uncharacterized protein (TIGR02588 family)